MFANMFCRSVSWTAGVVAGFGAVELELWVVTVFLGVLLELVTADANDDRVSDLVALKIEIDEKLSIVLT